METQTFLAAIPGDIVDWRDWAFWSAKMFLCGIGTFLLLYVFLVPLLSKRRSHDK